MMNLLETKRLIVKPPSLDNFENVYALCSDADVMHYVGRGAKSREDTRESIEKMIQHNKKHGFSIGDVYEKESSLFVGRAGLVYLEMNDDQPEIEIGYTLHKTFWKKGYATELAKACLDWGFEHLAVNKLVAVTHPENKESRHVLEKAGMYYLGIENCYATEVAKYAMLKNVIDQPFKTWGVSMCTI
jgi:ribosomal-protein-alanine N-acetyltransferase